jgi:hypothetical protein
MGQYSKAFGAVVGAVAVAVASAWTDSTITDPEWVMVAVSGWTAFHVFITANLDLPLWDKAKAVTAGALAGLGGLGGYLANGQVMSGALWLNVIIATATAAGVFAVGPAPVHTASPT